LKVMKVRLSGPDEGRVTMTAALPPPWAPCYKSFRFRT
jgi:hypothetical protein